MGVQVAPAARHRRAIVHRTATALLALLCVLAIIYAGLSTIVADRLSRPDRRAPVGSPADYVLAFEPVEFRSRLDGTALEGWWLPVAGSDRAIVVLHGRNSSRTGGDGALLAQSVALVRAGYNVLMYDSRAHGESGGVRYAFGALERYDVLSAIDLVRTHGIAAGRIGLLGHSMGAATALLAAPDAPDVAAVVADSPYARLTDLLDTELPRASGLPAFFNPGILYAGRTLFGVDLFAAAPEATIDRIQPRPVLFIHSETDELVPVEHSRRLWRLLGEPTACLWTVPGPRHDQIFNDQPEEYLRRVTTFFDRSIPHDSRAQSPECPAAVPGP